MRDLLAPWWLPYRHGLDAVSDLVTAVTLQAQDVAERRRAAAAAVELEHAVTPRRTSRQPVVPEDDEEGPGEDTGLVARFLTNPVAVGLALFVVLVLFGAREAIGPVSGGGLSAAPGDARDLWRLHLESWHALGQGTAVPAPPYVVVVAGLGIVPATDLAESVGLEVDDGILVDEYGRAGGREDVFAAGDVARFPAPALGGTRRVEHEDHANTHGRAVGANMAGANTPYDHLPFFYSDLFELGYEAVGDVDSRLATVAEWAEPNRKGVVAYVDDAGKARGFLLWDVWGKVDASRELISAGAVVGAEDLRALLA